MKFKIPTHDPYTGELNPHYEELTGEKHPHLIEYNEDETSHCFNLQSLIGKEFRYDGKYGISNWTDKVKNIEPISNIYPNPLESIRATKSGDVTKPYKMVGYTYDLHVRSTRGEQLYEFEKCIFLDN
jgi:hypothetical protein